VTSKITPETIAVTFQKGGTGKTFTATNLAGGLSARGYDVLLIDLDAQGSLTANLGYRETYMDADTLSLDELLVDVNKWEQVNELIIEHEEFDVIPANGTYSGTRTPLDSATNSEKRLTKVLAELDTDYHYIILDCPPSLDAFAKNGILAAKQVIVPVAPIYEMIHSTNLLLEMIEDIERIHDIDISYLAFVLSNVNYGTLSKQDKEMIDWFWDTFEQVGFEIRHRAAFDRGKWEGGSIYAHEEARDCDQFAAFNEFTDAIIDRTDAPPLTDTANDTSPPQQAPEGVEQ
jgi:chromosome partitioning protein